MKCYTLLLGSCKYLLQEFMPALSEHQKQELLARIAAFNTSGFAVKMYGNVCRYYQSFVGRDFKACSQMAVFMLCYSKVTTGSGVHALFIQVKFLFRCLKLFITIFFHRLKEVSANQFARPLSIVSSYTCLISYRNERFTCFCTLISA